MDLDFAQLLNDEELAAILEDDSVSSIQFLGIRNHVVGKRTMNALGRLHELKELSIDSAKTHDDDFAELTLNCVMMLYLSEMGVGNQAVFSIGGVSNLRTLHVPATNVSCEGIIKWNGAIKLQSLYLTGNSVSREGLCEIVKLPSLEELGLAYTNVNDSHVDILSEMRSLKRLDLEGTTVSDGGLRKLCASLNDAQILPPRFAPKSINSATVP